MLYSAIFSFNYYFMNMFHFFNNNYQETVRNGCNLLRKCEDMIGKLGLFSSNETKDDISTTNLKYLLVGVE